MAHLLACGQPTAVISDARAFWVRRCFRRPQGTAIMCSPSLILALLALISASAASDGTRNTSFCRGTVAHGQQAMAATPGRASNRPQCRADDTVRKSIAVQWWHTRLLTPLSELIVTYMHKSESIAAMSAAARAIDDWQNHCLPGMNCRTTGSLWLPPRLFTPSLPSVRRQTPGSCFP